MKKVKLSQEEYKGLLEKAEQYDSLVKGVLMENKTYYCGDVVLASYPAIKSWIKLCQGLEGARQKGRIKELENELLEERQKRLVLAGIVKEEKG